MSAKQITALTNQTEFKPDTAALLKQSPKAFENLSLSDEPLVLILHPRNRVLFHERLRQLSFDGTDAQLRRQH